MIKKFFCVIVLIALVIPVLAEDPAGPALDKKVGYALLDAYTQFFHDMAVSGGGYEKVSVAFRKFLADANQARQQNQIDKVFFSRYKRILAITGLAMIPSEFADVFNEELAHFIKDVLGEDFQNINLKEHAIGLLASALSEEILNLHLYLDDVEAKEKLRKALEGKLFPDTTPKKK